MWCEDCLICDIDMVLTVKSVPYDRKQQGLNVDIVHFVFLFRIIY